MVADIARVTYDPTRQYRSLIYQQGRVTLEADNNEGAALEGEALRLETIDIFGPATAIGAGYQVSSGTGPGGIIIGPGIFYLGGWRLDLDKALNLSTVSDIQVADFAAGVIVRQGNFVVSLLITEQSVCAVEDQALREVALGGPDSAARSRLMQKFPRIPLDGDTCDLGATAVATLLQEDGVTIDPYSLQLLSSATLQAGFVPGPANTDPCTPAAAGGYLGADNQMVRVTVTEFDAAKQRGVLLWGWNNASLLYRATMTNPQTLTLTNTPVDQEHAPQQNQMVEILRSELNLGDQNFIAEGQGFVTSLAQGYSFDTGEIVLADALPPAYQNNKNPLFVRVWQAEVPFNTGQPTALDDVSGITVSISMTALPTHIAARPFWRFAVRPATPQNIYPQRYADKPQPPDGPRQWITDLAVCEALESGVDVLEDCRNIWGGEEGGGCCGLVLGPDDVAARGGLQVVVDALSAGPAVLSLRPGIYPLAAPLVLQKNHNGLVIEGCCPTGTQLTAAAAKDMTPFRTGLIQLDGVENITLRQLEIVAPAVQIPINSGKQTNVELWLMSGVSIGEARGINIEKCLFYMDPQDATTIGAAIMVTGATLDINIRENRFESTTRDAELFGILAMVTTANASAELDQWDIVDNRFDNIAFATIAWAQLGLVGCRHNVAANCGTGFVFIEANLGDTAGFANQAIAGRSDVYPGAVANAAFRPDILAGLVNKMAPFAAAKAPAGNVSDAARKVLSDQFNASGAQLYQDVTGASTPPANPPAPAAGAKKAKSRAAAQGASASSADFDLINAVAVMAEVSQQVLAPAIRLEDNEVTVTAGTGGTWMGVGAILSPSEPGSVVVNGNRVVVPDATTLACSLMFPAGAVVSGNLFAQLALAPDGATAVPALLLVTRSPAIMVGANLASFTELIVPARSSSAVNTSWDFLNTTA